MTDINYVIDFCISILNTRITIEPFSFTFSQVWLGIACLAVVIGFIAKLFDL